MKVDILNATKKIAVEVNGAQHGNFNKFFHANSRVNYLKSINRDFKKLEWLEQNDYNLIEINHDEVESLSKSLSYIPSNHIGMHISSKLDFILLYLACIKINKVPIVLKTTWGREEINSIVDNHKINHITQQKQYV